MPGNHNWQFQLNVNEPRFGACAYPLLSLLLSFRSRTRRRNLVRFTIGRVPCTEASPLPLQNHDAGMRFPPPAVKSDEGAPIVVWEPARIEKGT